MIGGNKMLGTIETGKNTVITIETVDGAGGSSRTGLRDGEIRVTCIFTDEQNALLHDWAHTAGKDWREVTLAMADRYIKDVIEKYAEEGGKLRKSPKFAPEVERTLLADKYEADPFEEFFDL